MGNDVRWALRQWVKAPTFTAVALLTLALGIGANIAIFNLVNAVLLRPLPVSNPSQLTVLTNPVDAGRDFGTSGGRRDLLAYSEYTALRDQNAVFSGLLAAQSNQGQTQIAWGSSAGTEPAVLKLVSANYFQVLGISAYRGRFFASNEGQVIGADPIAVMSYGYWNQRFNRDPGVIGRRFMLHGRAFTVIGIAPKGFMGETVGQDPNLYVPLAMAEAVDPGDPFVLHDPPGVSRLMWLQVIGRRKPGVTLQQAQAAVDVIFQHLVQQQVGVSSDVRQRQQILGQRLELSGGAAGVSPIRGRDLNGLFELFALAGLVLVLAMVNLASLLLARAVARQKEVGVRLALGAGRGRIIRQLLTESVLLSAAGGVLGIPLALWGDKVILSAVSTGPILLQLNFALDWRMFAFVAALCVGVGVLFGLAPAWRMARLNLYATLQAQGRGGGRSRQWLGKTLVAVQVALSAILLVGAGLFLHSLRSVMDVPPGFQPQNAFEFGLNAGGAGYTPQTAPAYFQRALERIGALPGVSAVTLSMNGLFTGSGCGIPIAIDGYTAPKGQGTGTGCEAITAQYFDATGIGILAGRALDQADQSGAVKNVVVNETFVQRYLSGRNPIGQLIRDTYPDDHGAVYTIVGVARDARYNSLEEKPRPMMYLPFFNGLPGPGGPTWSTVLVRDRGNDAAAIAAVRSALKAIDPAVTMSRVGSLQEAITNSLAGDRFIAEFAAFFGFLALLLAAVGLYGTMSFGVARRTPEIGIRMALGASRGRVLNMILAETALVLIIGLAIGLPLAIAAAKLALSQNSLFGVKYWDTFSYTAAALALAAVTLAAGYLPARRASRIDPWQALREE